jgi:hypothetical protein
MSEDELLKIDALEEEIMLTAEIGWRSTIVTLLRSGMVELARDGWTIFPPEYFTEQGFPDRMIYELIKDHEGCSLDGRGGTVRGVYYLDFLYRLKSLFNLEVEGKLGRGSQAGEIIKALYAQLRIDRDV